MKSYSNLGDFIVQTATFFIIIGLLGGLAVGLQGPLTSLMSQRLGTMESIFIIHLGGAVAAAIPLLLWRGGGLAGWRSVPWYALGAGVLGLVVLGTISQTIPRLGVAPTIVLIVVGQLVLGTMLDHFGLLGAAVRPVDPARLIGIAVLLFGTWLIVR
jgi:transporter family-2 protein